MKRIYYSLLLLPLCSIALSACMASSPSATDENSTVSVQAASPAPTSTGTADIATPSPLETPAPTLDMRITADSIAPYFEDFDDAAMLLSDGDSLVVYNEALSTKRQSPYSTFKIPNALIALENGIIHIDDSTRLWDGTRHKREELNQDQDLASAIKHSCVWYFQALAREVGRDAIQSALDAMQYGNQDISAGVDSFWLGSSLLISPREQLDFIMELYEETLPFSRKNMAYVKRLLRQEGYPMDLYGKTGSSGRRQGCFVGYAPFDDVTLFFAVYIEGDGVSGLLARDITANVLSDHF